MVEKLILDLCGGTGSWSLPYKSAGYAVIVVDPEYKGEGRVEERIEEFCERTLLQGIVHGVLAAPPCTEFSASGACWWKGKQVTDPKYLEKALGTVFACLEVIKKCEPEWWCLENPVGRLSRFLGKPMLRFDPWEFGDPYTKKTCLWGKFTIPARTPVESCRTEERHNDPKSFFSRNSPEIAMFIDSFGDTLNRSKLRSITPPGFAQAFFKANP